MPSSGMYPSLLAIMPLKSLYIRLYGLSEAKAIERITQSPVNLPLSPASFRPPSVTINFINNHKSACVVRQYHYNNLHGHTELAASPNIIGDSK